MDKVRPRFRAFRLARLIAVAFAAAGVFTATLPGVAIAREDYCLNPTTKQIDRRATQAYRKLQSQSDQAMMNRLSGTWLSITPSPATNQVSYLYETFTPLGLYSYVNFVCTMQNTFCSRYDGTGLYAVRANSRSAFFGTKIVSDVRTLDHACLGLNGTFLNRNTIAAGTARWNRVEFERQ